MLVNNKGPFTEPCGAPFVTFLVNTGSFVLYIPLLCILFSLLVQIVLLASKTEQNDLFANHAQLQINST